MTPGNIVKRTVTDRLAWIDQRVDEIRALPHPEYLDERL